MEIRTIEGIPSSASLATGARDLQVPGRPALIERELRDQLARHAEASATHLVQSSVRVRWRCEVTGVVFAYPAMAGPDLERIAEQRAEFESGAEAAYAAARFGYGLVSWAYSPDGTGEVAAP